MAISERVPRARPRRVRGASGIDRAPRAWALRAISVGSILVLFGVWFAATNAGWVSNDQLPSPQSLWHAFTQMLDHGYSGTSLLGHVLVSLRRAMLGLLIGVSLGTPVGMLVGYFPWLNAALTPIFSFIRPVPALAFIPLVILYLGIGEIAKVFIVVVPTFLYMVLNTQAGVQAVPRDYVLAGLNLGLSQTTFFTRVILPYAAPFIVTGIKVSLALSWAVIVAAELIAAESGLGFLILDASVFYRVPELYIGIILIGLIGLALELTVRFIERRALHWVTK